MPAWPDMLARRGVLAFAATIAAASAQGYAWLVSLPKAARDEMIPGLKAFAIVVGIALLVLGAERSFGSLLSYVQMGAVLLVPIILALVRWGVVSAVVAAISGKILLAYWFYPLSLSLDGVLDEDLSDARFVGNLVTLAILLAGILRHQAREAARREDELRQLYAFSRKLVRAYSTSEIYAAIQAHLATILARKVVLLRPEGDALASIPANVDIPEAVRIAAADVLSMDIAGPDQVSTDAFGVGWLVRPVSSKTAAFGAIAVEVGKESDASLEKIGRQIADTLTDAVEALEHLEIDRAIHETKVRAEAERLREAMIGTVSHDLCTPLSSILCSATVLSSIPAVTADERISGLVDGIREEAERHSKDIQNLLDASRINSKSVRLNLEWTDVGDVVNSAVEQLQHRRGSRVVNTRLARDLPLVRVDALLLERALIQVLDNAAKYSDPSTPIRLEADVQAGQLVLAVSDNGRGLTAGERGRMWQRFVRGDRQGQATAGYGLGLWIAQSFVEANGGTIEADSAGPGRGTTISIRMPLATKVPVEAEQAEEIA